MESKEAPVTVHTEYQIINLVDDSFTKIQTTLVPKVTTTAAANVTATGSFAIDDSMQSKLLPLGKYLLLGVSDEITDMKQIGPFCAFREGQNLLKAILRNAEFHHQLRVGIIKDTEDCGTTSVSNGVAIEWARHYYGHLGEHDAVLIHNGGGGGFKFDIFGPKFASNGAFIGMVRISNVKLKKDEVPLLTHLIQENDDDPSSGAASEYRKQNEAMFKYANVVRTTCLEMIDKYNIRIRDVIAFATGKLRSAYCNADMFQRAGMMQRFSDFCKPLCMTHWLTNKHLKLQPERNLWILPQSEEAKFESIAIHGMYANLAKCGKLPCNLEIVFVGGVGTSSTQLSTGDLNMGMNNFVNSFTEDQDYNYTMLSERVVKQPYFQEKCWAIETAIDNAVKVGKIPVFALKSGFILCVPEN